MKKCSECIFNETPEEAECLCMVNYNKKNNYSFEQETEACGSYETNKHRQRIEAQGLTKNKKTTKSINKKLKSLKASMEVI